MRNINEKAIYEGFLNKSNLIDRGHYVRSLRNKQLEHVCCHLKDFLEQTDVRFRLPKKTARRMRTILEPHKPLLKKFLTAKNKKKVLLSRRQKGGAFLTILLGALVPIVADLIYRAVTKK